MLGHPAAQVMGSSQLPTLAIGTKLGSFQEQNILLTQAISPAPASLCIIHTHRMGYILVKFSSMKAERPDTETNIYMTL